MKTKLITKEIQDLVSSAIGAPPIGGDVDFHEYKLKSSNSFLIGSVYVIKINNEKPFMRIGEKYTKEYANLWQNDVGKVFVRELRRDTPDLYELKTSKFKALLKRIREDELEALTEKGLNHIQYGDFHYMIIKAVSANNNYEANTGDYDVFEEIEDIQEEDDYEPDIDDNDSFALF